MTEPRRFTEREVALIMEHASAQQNSADEKAEVAAHSTPVGVPGARGLTLEQLTEIGDDVGIPAEFVRRAALAVDRGELVPTSTHRWYGLPVGVSRTVDFGRIVDDAEWDRIVVSLRETFQARGRIQQDGAFRQWTNGNLQALLEPTATGHRLRLTTRKGNAQSSIVLGSTMLGTALAVVSSFAATSPPVTLYVIPLLLGVCGMASFAYTYFGLPSWARTRATQMEAITAGAVNGLPTAPIIIPADNARAITGASEQRGPDASRD